jgi:hypothetical protein
MKLLLNKDKVVIKIFSDDISVSVTEEGVKYGDRTIHGLTPETAELIEGIEELPEDINTKRYIYQDGQLIPTVDPRTSVLPPYVQVDTTYHIDTITEVADSEITEE